tara:strand:- start:898 stop:1065 length:168 start_codon:yes stop_codon:yes gene_type:complete
MAQTYIRGKLVDKKTKEATKSKQYKLGKLRKYFDKIKKKHQDQFDRDAYFDGDTF